MEVTAAAVQKVDHAAVMFPVQRNSVSAVQDYYYYYYYYYTICTSPVTRLFFPVLLLNQR